MNNIIAGRGNCVVTKTAKTLEDFGFNGTNCIKVIKPGSPNQSWIPDGTLNTLNGVIPAQTGLYVIAKGADADKTADFYPDGGIPDEGDDFETESSAYFARMATAGATLTPEEKAAYNAFVVSAKGAGYYSKLLELKIHWGSAAGAKLNTIGTSFTDVWTGITYARLGAFGNGTNGYSHAGFIPGTHFPGQFNYSFGAWINTNVDGAKIACGAKNGTDEKTMFLLPRQDNVTYISAHSTPASPSITGTTDGSGFWVITRVANNDLKVFKNGSQVGAQTTAETTLRPEVEFYDWAMNDAGTVNGPSDTPQALRFKAAGLTPTEAANFSSHMSTFLQAVD